MKERNQDRFHRMKRTREKEKGPELGHWRICHVCGGEVHQYQNEAVPYMMKRRCIKCGYKYSSAQWGLLKLPQNTWRP